MDRFLWEKQAVGCLEPHPNMLNAYDFGDESGVQYIATELTEGIQLVALIGRIGPLAGSEACKIVSQATLALEHLRKHNLVHRDIKPSNLMLTRDGTVKLVDMGLALLRDEQSEQITMTGEAMGQSTTWLPSNGLILITSNGAAISTASAALFIVCLRGTRPTVVSGRGRYRECERISTHRFPIFVNFEATFLLKR